MACQSLTLIARKFKARRKAINEPQSLTILSPQIIRTHYQQPAHAATALSMIEEKGFTV